LVAFLSFKEDVFEALALGYTMKDIWQHLKATEKISCRYETFVKYVKRYVKETKNEENNQQSRKHEIRQVEPKVLLAQEKPPPRSISSVFKIDHTLTKEDLKRI